MESSDSTNNFTVRKKIVWLIGFFGVLMLTAAGCSCGALGNTSEATVVTSSGAVPSQLPAGAPITLGSCGSTDGDHTWTLTSTTPVQQVAAITAAGITNCTVTLPAGNAVTATPGNVTLTLTVSDKTDLADASKAFSLQVMPATEALVVDTAAQAGTNSGGDAGAVGDPARTPFAQGTRTPVAQPIPATGTPTPTSAASAATTPQTPAPQTPTTQAVAPTATPTPAPQATTAAAAAVTGCATPTVALTLNGSPSCVSEAVCVSQGFGWKVTSGKCVGPPPCADGYAYDSAGTCRTPKYNCAHPQLDYDHLATCTTRADCGPSSDGYSISGTNCVYTVTCENGYTYDSGYDGCITTGYGCPYPQVDIDDDLACISPDDCFALGYALSDSQCIIVEVSCESGYFFDASFGCITSPYGCSYPDLNFAEGPNNCVSEGFCTPQSDGYFIVGADCIYEPPVEA